MTRAKGDYVSKKKRETEAARKLGSQGGRKKREFTWEKTPIKKKRGRPATSRKRRSRKRSPRKRK